MEVIEGFRRFSKIYVDNVHFAYRMNRKSEGKVFLRCYESGCGGSGIYMTQEEVFNPKNKHNHEPDLQLIEKFKFLQRVKERVENEDKNLLTIYQEECSNTPDVDHPSFDRIRSTLSKRRQFIKTSEKIIFEEDSKSSINLFPFPESSKEELGDNLTEAGNVNLDDDLKVLPQILNEYINHFPPDGKIVDIVEGPKRFSRVFIDDVGYAYQQNKKRKDGNIFLRCHTEGCSGSGVLTPKTMHFHRGVTHLHNPDPHEVLKLRFLHVIKLRSENETTNLSTIYKEEASRYRETSLPSYDKVKSTMRKRRTATLIQKPESNSSSSVEEGNSGKERLSVATHYIARKGMEVIEGLRRFSKIYIDNHSYAYLVNRKKPDGTLILRCHEEGCRGSGRYDSRESIFHKMAKHSHYPDPLLVTQWRFLHQCKKRAENEVIPVKTIYDQECLRYPNCNLPSFKRIESTLQKRRKSKRANDFLTEDSRSDCFGGSESPTGRELEVQLEEVYHPEGNPHYFISPNIAFDPPSPSKETPEIPTSIIVRTGKVEKFDLSSGRLGRRKKFDTADKELDKKPNFNKLMKALKLRNKRTNQRKSLLKMKDIQRYRASLREPRRSSDYKSKMDVMEGTKRFSKIFIDESHHIYRLNKARVDGVLMLKCYESKCRGTGLYFPVEEVFHRNLEHNHQPSTSLVAKCRLLSGLKTRVECENGPLRLIYEEEVAKYPGIEIPSFRKMESTLQKRRRAKVPFEPSSLREAALQLQRTDFTKCSRGNFFKRYLSFDKHEILVFVSPGPLEERFKTSKTFHLDGSFKVVPQGFAQVLIIHLVIADHVFPVVYALLSTKSLAAYIKFFEFLKEEYLELDPQFVSSDYDSDLETGFQTVFPNAIVTGYWFYYTQSIWRHLRTCGLAQVYFQDEEAKVILKCSMALPLLPPARICDGMTFLRSLISKSEFHLSETKNSLIKVMDFIEDYWVQRLGANRLSVFGLERKLNYDIEALYRLFIKKLGIEGPPLIRFVEKAFQAESTILSEYHMKMAGKSIRADRSRKCNENEKILKDITFKFEAGLMTCESFLTSASMTVPRHCHQDDLIYDPDEDSGVLQDPADVPSSLPFCEIRLIAPPDEDAKMPSADLEEGKDPSLFEGIEISPQIRQPGSPATEMSSRQNYENEIQERDLSALGIVWPPAAASSSSSSSQSSIEETSLTFAQENERSGLNSPNGGILHSNSAEDSFKKFSDSQQDQTAVMMDQSFINMNNEEEEEEGTEVHMLDKKELYLF